MKQIFPLPKHLISKIAAGEVIERPVYAVKELLDNSLDAGADEIKIAIEGSGLRKITVIDNGKGMSPEDLQDAWKLHTTSKLHNEHDLTAIQTLGFRGEALASIAAISKLVIKSKIKEDNVGAYVEIVDGRLTESSPIGLPNGTEASIFNLFGNIPARKKFLKSEQIELRHIVSLISSYAIAYPYSRFHFLHNDRVIFDIPKNNKLIERIALLFGASLQETLLPISFSNDYTSMTGFISKPQSNSILSQKQHIFINNRLVSDKIIMSAIRDAFAQVHSRNFQPIAFIFLKLPYEMVDVNIHPRKEEIRFHNGQMIYELVLHAVKKSLQQDTISQNWQGSDQAGIALADGAFRPGLTDSFAGELLRQNILLTHLDDSSEYLAQIQQLYIFNETRHGLQITDQHAAHERVLYERLLSEFRSKRKQNELVTLSKPQLFELSFADSQLMQEYMPIFAQIGFQIDQFKDTAFLLQSVPQLFKDRNMAKLLSEMLSDIQMEKKIKDVDTISKRMIAYLACRAAVKAGDSLTQTQMRDLLTQLAETENNATCPHGRPTRVEIEIGKIHKMFKRK